MNERDLDIRDFRTLLKYPFELLLFVLLVAIVTVTFIQVLFRYVFQLSLAWTEELARFIFMWLASLGAAYAFKTRSHFALRFIADKLSDTGQKILAALVTLLMSGFLLVFIWKAIEYVQSVSGQIGPSTSLPMAVPYFSAVVGGVLMLYYVIRNWWSELHYSD